MPRWPRRLVQLSALVFLLAVPALNYGGVLYQQYGKSAYHTVGLMGTAFERGLYRAFSATVGLLPDPAGASALAVGGFGSYSLFGVTFLDPVVALETLLRAPGAWAPLLAGASLTLLIAALLGRVFCGWLCPVNTVLEGFDLLRARLLPRLGLRPPDLGVPRWAKWALLAVGLAAALLADLAVWAHLLPHVQLGRDAFTLVAFGATTAGAPLLAGIVLAEMLLARRVWCRSLCPTGALLGLAGRLAPLRPRRAARACLEGCAACARACPMALDPAHPVPQAECLNCGLCLPACPEDLLRLLPARPRGAGLADWVPALRRVSLLVLAAVLASAAPAAAHHMRGQPHYGYTENYPQVPSKETRALMGRYEATVVSYFFQGLRRERSDTPDDVQFYVSLADALTHQSYTGPLTIELWREGRRLATFAHARPLEEAVYRIRQAVPGPGRYVLRLAAGETRGEVPVDVEGERASWTPYYLAAAALFAALLMYRSRRRFPFRRKRGGHVARGA